MSIALLYIQAELEEGQKHNKQQANHKMLKITLRKFAGTLVAIVNRLSKQRIKVGWHKRKKYKQDISKTNVQQLYLKHLKINL